MTETRLPHLPPPSRNAAPGVSRLRQWIDRHNHILLSILMLITVAWSIAIARPISLTEPIDECHYLNLLKREALRCSPKVIIFEAAETRLACADRRALRVAESLGHAPPARHAELIALFAQLDAEVHKGVRSPAAATRALEAYIQDENCLSTFQPAPETP